MAHPSATSTFISSSNSGLQVVNNSGKIVSQFHPLSESNEGPPLPSSSIPFPRDTDFVEHGDILTRLEEKGRAPGSRVALVGLGGVGKSQLAIEYGYRTRARLPDSWVFWIHAGTAARFEQSYREIAEQVKIQGRQDPQANIISLVREWLRDPRHGCWLVILDNLDDACVGSELEASHKEAEKEERQIDAQDQQALTFTSYLPCSEHGRVLLTTRSRIVALTMVEEKDSIAVGPMAESDALSLFKKKLDSVGKGEEIAALVVALDCIPLAIVQAATYISQRAPRCSVKRYLEDFQRSERRKISLLDYEGGRLRRDPEAHNSIIITWQLSFNHIRRTRPSAAGLLSLVSFFDRQGIPEDVVRKRPSNEHSQGGQDEPDELAGRREGEDDDDKSSQSDEDDGFEDDVLILRRYSLLSVETKRTFAMHALVQLATRRWLSSNGQFQQWQQLFITNLSAEFPGGRYENWKRCQALFPHAKSAATQPPGGYELFLQWYSLLCRAFQYAYDWQSFAEATRLLETVMEVTINALGQEHNLTLDTMDVVGTVYSIGRRYRDAEQLHEQVLRMRRKVLGQEHPETLDTMSYLALTYRSQRRNTKAERLQIQMTETSGKVLG